MLKKASILFSIFCLFSISAFAETNRFSVVKHYPLGGAGDLINTFGSLPLHKNKWRFLTEVDYGYHPLQITRNGVRVQGVIDHLIVQHFGISYAPADFWQIDIDLPAVWGNVSRDLVIPARPLSNKTDVGDVILRNRFTLLHRDESPVGVVLVPFITLPSGNDGLYVGEHTVTGGGILGIDHNFGDRVFIVLNVGAEFREHVSIFDLDMGHRFLLSGGLGVKASDNVTVRADVTTATPFGHFFGARVSSPTGANLGLDIYAGKGVTFNVGGEAGLIRGASQPRFATRAGLTFTPGGRSEEPVKVKEPEKVIAVAPVYFTLGSKKLSKEAMSVLDKGAKEIRTDSDVITVRVIGYADATGNALSNKKLSLARAKTVSDYLVKQGVRQSLLVVESRGSEEGAAGKATQSDRRVEVKAEFR